MSVLLLRTLTRKSIIGFGYFRDLTIQNLLDMCMHRELLSIYYNMRNIDFAQDIKDELCIYGDREINKKDKKEERFDKDSNYKIRCCIQEYLSKKTTKELTKQRGIRKANKSQAKITVKKMQNAQSRTIYGKASQQRRNHGRQFGI